MADYFMDFSAGTNGTGTFESPFNWFGAATAALAEGDTIWVRRVTKALTGDTTNLVPLLPKRVNIVGWPKSGDTRFADRPSVAQASWDADAANYATITNTLAAGFNYDNLSMFNLSDNVAGRVLSFSRVEIRMVYNSSVTSDYDHAIFGSTSNASCTNSTTLYTENCAFSVNVIATMQTRYLTLAILKLGSGSAGDNGASSDSFTWFDTGSILSAASTGVCQCAIFGWCIGSATRIALSQDNYGTHGKQTQLYFTRSTFTVAPTASCRVFQYRFDPTNAYSPKVSGVFENCTFTDTTGRTANTWWMDSTSLMPGGTLPLLFSRCTFNTQASADPAFNVFEVGGNCVYWRCSFNGFSSIKLTTSTRLDVFNFVQGMAAPSTGAALDLYSGGTVHVANAVFVAGNTADVKCGGQYAVGSGFVEIRCVTEGTGGYLTMGNGEVVVRDINNVPGTLRRYTYEGVSAVHSGKRTGGGTFSYTATWSQGGAVSASDPHRDEIRTVLTAGQNTITVHVATTATVTSDNLWVEVAYTDGTRRRVVSSAGVSPVSETAAWTGIVENVSSYAMSVAVSVSTTTVASVRVLSRVPGTVYVDPVPTVG